MRIVEGRPRDLGGFSVRRVLPADGLQTVGPFIFFDHMGPAVFAPGAGVDVRPHPHIGLATVTYLYAGEFMHRDSLGTAQLIRPGQREPLPGRIATGADLRGDNEIVGVRRQRSVDQLVGRAPANQRQRIRCATSRRTRGHLKLA